MLLGNAGCSEPVVASKNEPPRLVVSVVFDQLASWLLDESLGHLDPQGAIRSTASAGVYHHRVSFDYAGTFTAPGHVAIYTGMSPSQAGVASNNYWDRKKQSNVPSTFDAEHPTFQDSDPVSPRLLRERTVGDYLKLSSKKSRVVSLSIKDRAAVFSGGQNPDMALWYSSESGGYTTSTYYAKALPNWLVSWNKTNSSKKYMQSWAPLDAEALALYLGRDDAPGEEHAYDLGTKFPHDPRNSKDPNQAFLHTPRGADMLFDLASKCVEVFSLGKDDAPDLLALSISSTDLIGHVFGPNSWEALDNLIRVDRALGALFRRLSQNRDVAFVITADHGVPPLTEYTQSRGVDAGRVSPKRLSATANSAIRKYLGKGEWVSAVVDNGMYLKPEVLASAKRTEIFGAVRKALKASPGVLDVFEVAELKSQEQTTGTELKDLVRRSLSANYDADLWLVFKPYFQMDVREFGLHVSTVHGSPWRYDLDVPVLFSGPGVQRLETREPLQQSRVASTLASFLHTRAPNTSVQPLPGTP